MGEQAVKPGDAAESAMGDAGKGSFQESQNKSGSDAAHADAAEERDEDWHAKLEGELDGRDGPKEGKQDAAGPGRGRS